MKKTKYVLFLLILFLNIPSLTSAREGLRGSLSYTYEEKIIEDHNLNKKTEENFFLQKYNLDWGKTILLEKGALGILDANFSLGYNVLDKNSTDNASDKKVENFNNRWFLSLIITPVKIPIYFEALTERTDVSDFDSNFGKTQYQYTHNKITFKYVMPKYFYLYDSKFGGNGGNGNGNGNGFGNGNGNGMFWGGNGNGNGMFWGGNGNGNGGLLGGNGNGNGNGGFFNGNGGNGNGFGNGNGNGRGLINNRVGSLVPYAYLFNWDNNITESYNSTKSRLDLYTLNLGFLKFWINSNYEKSNDNSKLLVEFGQRRYDGGILWTLVSNWISSASYFVYEKNESNNKTTLERYEGNFLFKTYRSNWYSNLPTRLTYYDKMNSELLELRVPFSFYGTTLSLNPYSGALTYDYDKNTFKVGESFNKSRITNNYGISFGLGEWSVSSRHDLVMLFDDITNSSDYTTFNYRISFNQQQSLDRSYNQSASYELTVNKKLEQDEKLFQVHSANYSINYSGIDKVGLNLSESLSYYDQGAIPVSSNDYISQNKVVDVKIEPKSRSIRNGISVGISYNPLANLSMSGVVTNDMVFYDSGEEMKNTYRATASYNAIERMLTITGEASYYELDTLTNNNEKSFTSSLRVTYKPTYTLSSATQYSYSKTDYINTGVEIFDTALSEEITYTYYYGKMKTKKLFDLRALAKMNRYKNKSAIVADLYQGKASPDIPKTLISYEGNITLYPHRFLTVGGNIKKEYFKEDSQSEFEENLVYTLNASLNFPLLSISAFYQEINKRIDANTDERRFNISLTKRF